MTDDMKLRALTPIAEASSEAFSRFMDTALEIEHFAEVVVKAAREHFDKAPRLGELVVEYDSVKHDPESEAAVSYWKRERHRQDAAFLKGAIGDGFPLVYSQAAVSVWGRLEAHIDDVVMLLLSKDPSLFGCEAFESVTVSLGQWEKLPQTERPEHVLLQLQNKLSSKLKDAHLQFESMFKALGFRGEIPDVTKRTLIEFGTVRNVVVHRRGIIDKQALKACPWLGEVGAEIRVNEPMFDRYVLAAIVYAALVQQRIHTHYDGGPFPPLTKLVGSFQSALDDITAGRSHPGYVRLT